MELRGDVFKKVDASSMDNDSITVGDVDDYTRIPVEFEQFDVDSSDELNEELHGAAERALLESDADSVEEDLGYELVREMDETSAEVAFVVVKPHL